MRTRHLPAGFQAPSLPFILLAALLSTLWVAGGASRGDVAGQVVVRGASWLVVIVAILFGPRPSAEGARPVLVLLLAALGLVLLQLVPLPPSWWSALPGREPFTGAAAGGPDVWRPWSLTPGATVNAASSLIVPFAVLLLAVQLPEAERGRAPGLILCLVAGSTLVGLLQFSGVALDNPLVNDSAGQVAGAFANRNHFALFLAFGCMLAPVWAFRDGRRPEWRGPVALGLVLLFALTILASGSRAGLVLGLLGLGFGLILVRQGIRTALARHPRWAFPALVAGVLGLLAIFVLLSVRADRAVSIERLTAVDQGSDMRARGLPTVLAMIRDYFPAGSGLGGFDPVFRMHEPFGLLKLTYFNHAHNDFLEVVMDAGLPGLLLLAAGIAWWAWASVRAWRAGTGVRHALPKLGSATILLLLAASAVDYPARTPMMMAVAVIAGLWLNMRPGERPGGRGASALPGDDRPI